MKKLLLAVLGVVIVLAAAVVILPSVIDLRPRIVAAVRAATGRDLRIDGPLHIALLPKLRVSATGIHLSNAPGAAAPEMFSLDSVALQAEVWPLLSRRLVVDSLVLEHPTVNLEVDKAGRPNWTFQPQGKAAAAPAGEKAAQTGSALAGLQIGDVKLDQGQVSYRDDVTGQTIDAKGVTLAAAMAAPESPLSVQLRMTLNDEPVAAQFSVDTLGKLESGQQAAVKLTLDAKEATAKFDGTAQQRPVPGLNGVFALDIPSVGKLQAWLKQPLPKAQTDPGSLAVRAKFSTEGAKSALQEATIVGAGLSLKASGSIDSSGPVTKVAAVVEGGVLDVDRYLPPRAPAGAQAPAAAAPTGAPAAGASFALSEQPFDLAPLRGVDADVKISVAGIRAMGYEVGRIALAATAKGGVLAANLSEVPLYGGIVASAVKLDGSGRALGLDASVKVDHVALDKLAPKAASGAPLVSGVVSASFDAKAQGVSPLALAEDARGHLAVDLGGAAVKAAGAAAISALKLDVDLPGGGKGPSLAASAVYNGEQVDVHAALAPLRELASGGRFPAKLAVDSKLVTVRWDGSVQQKPVPGLDGTFDLDVPSAAKLAAWAGEPLGAKQPDPGELKVHATLGADGAKLSLKDASVTGKAIKATAQATFDGSRAPAAFDAKIDVEQADLNAYLPPPAETPAAQKPAAQAQQQAAGWSAEPFDLAPLGDANGKAEVTLAGVRYREVDVSKGDIKLALADRVFKLAAEKLALAQGTIDAATTIDASSGGAKLESHVAVSGVQARPLLQTFAGSDRLGGTIEFETTVKGVGKSEKDLISSLDGSGHFKITDGAIYGVNLAQTLRKVGTLGTGGSETEKTDFAELSGTYTIKAGVIENHDMKMLAPLLRLTGSGTVPMPPRTVDYAVEAKLVATTQGQGGSNALAGLPIPIKVTGTWDNPSYKIDWGSVFHNMSPDQLKSLPSDLGAAAKNFGVSLPSIPGVGTSASPGALPSVIPGLPAASAPGGQPPAPAGGQPTPSSPPFGLPKGLLGK
jgi:AsmA protein